MTYGTKMFPNLFVCNYCILFLIFVDYDLWKKYVPQPVSVKMGNVGEYYDILEELGRFVFDHS